MQLEADKITQNTIHTDWDGIFYRFCTTNKKLTINTAEQVA